MNIIPISSKDKLETLHLYAQAFASFPQMPALAHHPHLTHPVMQQLYHLYQDASPIHEYGIKKDNKIISALYCIDSNTPPRLRHLLQFIGSLFWRKDGLTLLRQFHTCAHHKPAYHGVCLEVLLYGTLPTYQHQGYGKALMHHIFTIAEQKGYVGVTGVTNNKQPAYHFYMKEGWLVDTTFKIESETLCWVRYKL